MPETFAPARGRIPSAPRRRGGEATYGSRLSRFVNSHLSGGYGGGAPPLPIPNREVKPACADGTAMQCGRVGGRPLFSVRSPWATSLWAPFFVPVCAEALPTPTCRQGETDRQGKRLSVFPSPFHRFSRHLAAVAFAMARDGLKRHKGHDRPKLTNSHPK